jgi:hypothetical protein
MVSLWSALNPGVWVTPGDATGGTWTLPEDAPVDKTSGKPLRAVVEGNTQTDLTLPQT